MSRLPFYFALLLVFAPLRVASVNQRYFHVDELRIAKTFFACLNRTATELFDDGNRIGVICYQCGYLENEIIRMFMKTRTTVVSNRPLYIKERRAVSYVVFATGTFKESKRELLGGDENLRLVQYLFVNTASQETVLAFADKLWRKGFRDIAFITLDESGDGNVHMPVMIDQVLTLKSMGHCSPSGDDLKIVPYASNFYRFCKQDPCTLLHGAVSDDTVKLWREEDKLKLADVENYETMGKLLINRFASFYGIVPRFVINNLTWPQAGRMISNGELDLVTGLMPNKSEMRNLNDIEIACWYRDRVLKIAAPVRKRLRDYPVLQMLTPLHYTSWVCLIVALLSYTMLLYILGRFADKGLIGERLRYEQIYEVMMNQDTESPKRTSLRAVLALWMIFSLNMSIIYNSTFTSSLADMDMEDNLRSINSLRRSGRDVCGPPIAQSFIKSKKIRYIVMKRAQDVIDSMMSNNTMGVIQRTTIDRLNWATRMDRNLRIYALKKPMLIYPVLFYTKVGHPYRVPFERIVTEYRESGLLLKWIRYYQIEENKEISGSKEEEDDDSGILNMDHLGPIFKLFFGCQTISVLVFLIELLIYYVPRVSCRVVVAA